MISDRAKEIIDELDRYLMVCSVYEDGSYNFEGARKKFQKLVEELENPTQELSFEILGW